MMFGEWVNVDLADGNNTSGIIMNSVLEGNTYKLEVLFPGFYGARVKGSETGYFYDSLNDVWKSRNMDLNVFREDLDFQLFYRDDHQHTEPFTESEFEYFGNILGSLGVKFEGGLASNFRQYYDYYSILDPDELWRKGGETSMRVSGLLKDFCHFLSVSKDKWSWNHLVIETALVFGDWYRGVDLDYVAFDMVNGEIVMTECVGPRDADWWIYCSER